MLFIPLVLLALAVVLTLTGFWLAPRVLRFIDRIWSNYEDES